LASRINRRFPSDALTHKLIDELRKTAATLERQMAASQVALPARVQPATNDQHSGVASAASKLAYSLSEVNKLVGISRSAIYLALRAGELRAVKSGRKTLVLAKELDEWLEKLPAKK
jgi:excisionase family DNA binding protein